MAVKAVISQLSIWLNFIKWERESSAHSLLVFEVFGVLTDDTDKT